MTYHAKTQQGIIVFLFAMVALTSSINVYGYEKGNLFLRIALPIFLLVAVFIKYKLTINEDYLIYQIFIFKIPIYQKEFEPNQINQIKFIRIGWAKKGAIIKPKKGFNTRVLRFEPDDVYTDLIGFANKNSIAVSKTKDYLILEK
ncbi:hypothetical protein [Robertmurraya kyonggiensis]|uniref:PH domain-containing protein n=1 Tax=Robertmurraya kyonggiensis TaxID=1037680 RepID=A0A4U1DBQ8_9BACI|nr:hypothetical protein [Robertmurraya kyonggiensis]TKC20041.1 hypothetical protein FA727_11035 [Robertmurraya kyonggiensis]